MQLKIKGLSERAQIVRKFTGNVSATSEKPAEFPKSELPNRKMLNILGAKSNPAKILGTVSFRKFGYSLELSP